MTILAKSPYRGAARPHSLYFAAEKVADRAVSYLYGSYSGDMWGSALEYAQDRAALVECGRAAADAGSRRAVRMRVRDLWKAVRAAFLLWEHERSRAESRKRTAQRLHRHVRPDRPLSDGEIIAKFMDNAQLAVSPSRAGEMRDAILAMDEAGSARELASVLGA